MSARELYVLNTTLNLTNIVITDVDAGQPITATLTLSNTGAGSLSTATSNTVTSTYVSGTGVWTASGVLADVNVLLAGVSFVPATNFVSAFTIITSVSDGSATVITGSKPMSVAVFDALSGARFGYSLRKLKSNYSGNCIEVTRTSDSTTQNIGFVNNDLDVASIATFCSGTTGKVTKWYDQSGNNDTMTPSALANAPIIYTSGAMVTTTANSQYALNTATGINLSGTNNFQATANTHWIVGVQFSQLRRYLFINNPSPDYAMGLYFDTVANRIEMFAGASAKGNGTLCPINAASVYQIMFNSANSSYTVNGVAGGALTTNPGTNPGISSTKKLTLGVYEPGLDRTQEWLSWTSALSADNRTIVDNNVNSFYTIY
jgi:hypothetical protein